MKIFPLVYERFKLVVIIEGSTSRKSEEFQGLTVERLRALLKERGLSTRGKKVNNTLHVIHV